LVAFLSAGLDAYGEAGRPGVARGNIQAFANTPGGACMFDRLSAGVGDMTW